MYTFDRNPLYTLIRNPLYTLVRNVLYTIVRNTHLAFDFIEMFRQQAVDRVIISMLQKKEKLAISNDGLLDEDTRAKLIANIYERLHRFEKYRGESRRFSDIINLQAFALANYIRGDSTSFKPYIAKW